MRTMAEIQRDIRLARHELAEARRTYGGRSVEAAEAREQLEELQDELEFSELHEE